MQSKCHNHYYSIHNCLVVVVLLEDYKCGALYQLY